MERDGDVRLDLGRDILSSAGSFSTWSLEPRVVSHLYLKDAQEPANEDSYFHNHVALDYGFIAVRNATQDEAGLSSDDVREIERKLFTTDPKLRQLSEAQWGIHTLVDKIVAIQGRMLAGWIPLVKVEPARCSCSKRHMMQCSSVNEGSTFVG